MTSSSGIEELQVKYVNVIGKVEIAQCLLSYVEATPIKDASGKVVGSQIVWILNVDVAGALPDFIKAEIGKKQTEGLDMLIAYIQKNYKA